MQAKKMCLIFWTSEKEIINLNVMLIENKIIVIPFAFKRTVPHGYVNNI